MSWRQPVVVVTLGLALTGCFAKILPFAVATSDDAGVAAPDASLPDLDGDIVEPDGAIVPRPEPVPQCAAGRPTCIDTSKGWIGAALIDCAGIPEVGPVTLLLEEAGNGGFRVVDSKTLSAPGFATTFAETSGQAELEQYMVCIHDAAGARCGQPFPVQGAPSCNCAALSCQELNLCNTVAGDGCGGALHCGACGGGVACNDGSCCPPGEEADGVGVCVCAPPSPCPRGEFWNVADCACEFVGG